MTNTELIRQEIERRIGAMYNFSSGYSALNTCRELLDFIDSLPEGKEIDLEDEIIKYWKDISSLYGPVGKEITRIDFDDVCRYFYELGINARKEAAQEIRGEVVKDRRGKLIVRASGIRDDLLLGDKVKIYIIKDEAV